MPGGLDQSEDQLPGPDAVQGAADPSEGPAGDQLRGRAGPAAQDSRAGGEVGLHGASVRGQTGGERGPDQSAGGHLQSQHAALHHGQDQQHRGLPSQHQGGDRQTGRL